jgi:hypothetical protein
MKLCAFVSSENKDGDGDRYLFFWKLEKLCITQHAQQDRWQQQHV